MAFNIHKRWKGFAHGMSMNTSKQHFLIPMAKWNRAMLNMPYLSIINGRWP